MPSHLGDGNIHFNLLQPPHGRGGFLAGPVRSIAWSMTWFRPPWRQHQRRAWLGRLRREDIAPLQARDEIELMRRIKAALIPGIMNPGKLLPARP